MSQSNLGSFGKFIRGKGIPKGHVINGDGFPCIRYAEIYTSYDEITDNLISRISEENSREALEIGYGDIIFPTSGETAEEIGKAVAYLGSETAYAGGDTLVLRDHGQNPAYLAYALNEWQAVKQKARLSTGQSVVHLYASELGQVSIWLPPLAEQERIVEILSDADAAINAAERLESAVSKRVRGLQHGLISLPLHAREWDSLSFNNSLEQKSEKSAYSNEYPVLTSSRRGLFLQDEYFSRQVASSDNAGYLILRKGDFTYRAMTDDDTFVFNHLLQYDVGIVSPAYAVFSVKNADPIFFRHLLNCKAFGFEITKISQGGTRKSLKFSALKSLDFCLPKFEKQVEIGRTLSAAEQEIIHLSNTTAALKKQKRGLMQQLLTGKLRVPEQV